MNNKQFEIDLLNKNNNQELKKTINSIMNSSDLSCIQQSVDNFAKYREVQENEKVGEYHSIVRLFALFGELDVFKTSIIDKTNCVCGLINSRVFELGPLLSVTTSNLKNSKGNLSATIITSLKSFLRVCPTCQNAIKIFRKITSYPTFLILINFNRDL